MSLTNFQLEELCERMSIPLEGIYFKDELPDDLEYNKSYIVNMENEKDEDGYDNTGSHWVCFQVNKYPNGLIEGIYFDSFGLGKPPAIKKSLKSLSNKEIPETRKNIQSIVNHACGWYCCAFLHFINSCPLRTKDLYTDVSHFLDLFDDLDNSIDFKKNEYILKHFFRSPDKETRDKYPIEIDVNTIVRDAGIRPDLTKV